MLNMNEQGYYSKTIGGRDQPQSASTLFTLLSETVDRLFHTGDELAKRGYFTLTIASTYVAEILFPLLLPTLFSKTSEGNDAVPSWEHRHQTEHCCGSKLSSNVVE